MANLEEQFKYKFSIDGCQNIEKLLRIKISDFLLFRKINANLS